MTKCPNCGEEGTLHRDSVDVGVGIIHGPYGCEVCGWSEDPAYDLSKGQSPLTPEGGVKDQFGGVWPSGSTVAAAYRMAENPDEPITGFKLAGKTDG